MRLGTILKLLGGLLLVLIVGALVVVMNIDFDRYKGQIAQVVEQQTGRKLTISGKLSLSFLPAPALSISNVALANAAWGTRPEMARFGRLEAEVELLPLIFGGNVKVSRLVLRDVDLMLETDKQGRGNWQFSGPGVAQQSSGAPASLPDFDEVRVQNVNLTYRDGVSGQVRTMVLKQLSASSGPRGLSLQATAAVERAPVHIKAELGPISDLLRSGRPYPLQGEVSVLGASAKLQGTIAQPMLGHGLDIGVSASLPDARALAALAGIDLPAMPVRVAAQITGDTDKSLSFKKLDAGFGGSSITGEASVTFGGDRTKLVARVQSPLLDLTEFAGKRTPPAKAPNDGRLFSDKPLPVQALGLADADISLDVAQVRTEAGPLDQFKLRLTLNNRLLELKPVAGNISGGKFIASLLVSGRQEPATVKLDLSAQQLNVGPLLKQATGKDTIEDKADFSADLAGSGNSVRALMASLDGKTDLTMGKGRINNGYVDLIAADVLQQVAPWAKRTNETTLNCMVSSFDIKNGLATSRGLLIDTANETIQGEGTIDLRSEQLALQLKPRPKEASLISLATPINVGGTLMHPSFAPDTLAVAKGVAGAVVGTAINPLGVLIPFISGGSDKNPCLAALQGGKTPPSSRSTSKDTAPAKEGGITGFFKGLGREIDKTINGK